MANFRARARAVDLLGKQQIRDEVTAISELLRNSYDADATEGLINVDTIQETILVWDDGEGMSETDVQENWLTLGTYSKVKNNKTKKDRVKIGEKGIGRLAISLLGDQLLLISKKKDIGIWTILFLHWDLFRNEKAYLEAIKVPLRAFNSLESLLSFIKIDFDSLKKELLSNLDDSEIWEENISNKIKGDIDQFKLSEDAINKLKLNEKRGGGTLFYISSLAAAWDWSIYKSKIKDESLRRRVQRLKDVVFSFVNLIDLFDNEISYNGIEQNSLKDINVKDKNFTPKIHIDGLKLENETWFNLGDMTLFDYALKGEIINGVFNGQSIIRYPDKIETTEINNIPLTKGMYINSLKDCGPIKIKWFFLEGTEKLSSLSKDQFNTMMEKLDQMGGIFVFRDGLRILPYGEPGNDFLNIEYRRSKGAGYYLFSHRRMFGFMEISKEKNPELIDKSSREGFIENKEFNFFRTVAENLLLWWATDYL
ncbi:MAG TPA: ATP-binding protein, partial [Patescibacteria group bacterium]|nr:ATP-binding protein [Patescibacteria group bacterium]